MARVTVDDCLRRIPNRFVLAMVAAKRARQLEMEGAESELPWENDKSTVLALREIASGLIGEDILEISQPMSGNVHHGSAVNPASGESGEDN